MIYKTISSTEVNGVTIVEVLERRIYLKATEAFKEELIPLIETGHNRLIVDLSKVSVMNSAGLGVLILARDMVGKQGGFIKLVGLQPLMKNIFARMKLDTLFDIYESREEALETVQ